MTPFYVPEYLIYRHSLWFLDVVEGISIWPHSNCLHLPCSSSTAAAITFLVCKSPKRTPSYPPWSCSNLFSTLKLKFLSNAGRTMSFCRGKTLQSLLVVPKMKREVSGANWVLQVWAFATFVAPSHTTFLLAHPHSFTGLFLFSESTFFCCGTAHIALYSCHVPGLSTH